MYVPDTWAPSQEPEDDPRMYDVIYQDNIAEWIEEDVDVVCGLLVLQ